MLVNLNCPNCGAALPAQAKNGEVIVCEYCHTSFRAPESFTMPDPGVGDLMLGADFNSSASISTACWQHPSRMRALK